MSQSYWGDKWKSFKVGSSSPSGDREERFKNSCCFDDYIQQGEGLKHLGMFIPLKPRPRETRRVPQEGKTSSSSIFFHLSQEV